MPDSFFISRAGEDKEWGLWIAEVLREAGCDYFLQDEDIETGHSFVERIRGAMEKVQHVIAVLSPDYLGKEHTMAELDTAYALDPTGKKRVMLMVRVRPCEIPKFYSRLVYLDLPVRDAQAKRMLLVRISGEVPNVKGEYRTFAGKLTAANPTLFGRDRELAILDRAWSDPAANFFQIIAPGGAGKTALMDKWFRAHLNEATFFGWSFYDQGTSEDRQTSSDPFFAELLPFLGIILPPTASVYAKAEAIARRLREERVLLVLDGVEPLQDSTGLLRDQGLKALLQELATKSRGLVLCTTRIRIEDVPDDPPRALSIDLDNLDPEHGAQYLRHFGVEGTEEELRKASAEYGNHALALTLLGSYLSNFCGGDVRRRVGIQALMVDDVKRGAHARRVMEEYARMFAGKPELHILRALGYFDRPAEPAALKLVLPEMPERKYQGALKRLRDARLILSADPDALIDCHPLVREYFADVMQNSAPDEFREGHSRLSDYCCKQAPDQPDTVNEMTPLFYAVFHGCQARRYRDALAVYNARILRDSEYFLVKVLGQFGANLSLLAGFFESTWNKPVGNLASSDQCWLLSLSAYSLRALGRLSDSGEPMRLAAERLASQENWKQAALSCANLSDLHLALGDIRAAIAAARQSVFFADRTGEASERLDATAGLADAINQSGDSVEAGRLFEEAESMRAELNADCPILPSVYGYCDLLLSQGRADEVLLRATQTLPLSRKQGVLLDIGLDHLFLGRAHPAGSPESAVHLNHAVDYLRLAGMLEYLPLALLARGTQHDLDEVFKIATRFGMRLHLTDYHLAQARLYIRENRRDEAQPHIEKAAKLIEETGYHRRDAELAALKAL